MNVFIAIIVNNIFLDKNAIIIPEITTDNAKYRIRWRISRKSSFGIVKKFSRIITVAIRVDKKTKELNVLLCFFIVSVSNYFLLHGLVFNDGGSRGSFSQSEGSNKSGSNGSVG